MNISKTPTKAVHFKLGCCAAAILTFSAAVGGVHATTLPGVASAPVGAAVQSAGGLVSAVGQGHAGIAPTVSSAAPTVEPLTDGVTNGLLSVGGGITATGQQTQASGLSVSPVAGAQSAVQALRSGTLAQVRAGSLSLGKGAAAPIVGVGVLSSAPPQGTLATAGVANANALLNANVAPQ